MKAFELKHFHTPDVRALCRDDTLHVGEDLNDVYCLHFLREGFLTEEQGPWRVLLYSNALFRHFGAGLVLAADMCLFVVFMFSLLKVVADSMKTTSAFYCIMNVGMLGLFILFITRHFVENFEFEFSSVCILHVLCCVCFSSMFVECNTCQMISDSVMILTMFVLYYSLGS